MEDTDMLEGFFRITFTGMAGSGFGLLTLQNGIVVGADVSGTTYEGSYTTDPITRVIEFQIIMNLPAGVTPVQNGIPLVAPISVPISGSLSENELGKDEPTLLRSPLGPVNVLFTKIRDLPHWLSIIPADPP
jgi:hypothetical protein